MIVAFEAAASCTSFSVIPPTPRWTNASFTSSRSSLRRLSVIASSVPWTSAFKIRLSVADSPRWICSKRSSSLAPGAVGDGACPATRNRRSRVSPIVRAVDGSMVTRNSSPAFGRLREAREPARASKEGPLSSGRPGRRRGPSPFPRPRRRRCCRRHAASRVWTITVATGPRPTSRFASSTVPRARPSGLARQLRDLGHERQLLEQVVDARSLRGRRPRP